MKFKKVPLEIANQIVNYLKTVNVPAVIGADLVNIANAIDKAELVEEKDEKKGKENK